MLKPKIHAPVKELGCLGEMADSRTDQDSYIINVRYLIMMEDKEVLKRKKRTFQKDIEIQMAKQETGLASKQIIIVNMFLTVDYQLLKV